MSMNKLEDILDSYRSRGVMKMTITYPDGKTEEQEMTFESAWTKADHEYGFDMEMIMKVDDPEEGPQEISMYMVDDTVAMAFGDQWLTQSRENENLMGMPTFLLDPDALFTDIADMKNEGKETINGVKTVHYSFDSVRDLTDIFGEAAAQKAGLKSMKGDVWVAEDGSYVVKSSFEATAEDVPAPGDMGEQLTEQTISWELEVYDVDSDISIELPESASRAGEVNIPGFEPGEFPLPPDTTVVTSMGEFAMLESSLSEADITAFFDEALTNLGWSKADGPFPSWTKGDYRVDIIIAPGQGEGMTSIMIQGTAGGS